MIYLTADVRKIYSALLNHCEIHFYQLDLEGMKPNNKNQIFCLTLWYAVRVLWLHLNTPSSIWYITLCCNAPQHTINQNTFVGHLQSKHIYFALDSQMMQCDFIYFLFFLSWKTATNPRENHLWVRASHTKWVGSVQLNLKLLPSPPPE